MRNSTHYTQNGADDVAQQVHILVNDLFACGLAANIVVGTENDVKELSTNEDFHISVLGPDNKLDCESVYNATAYEGIYVMLS